MSAYLPISIHRNGSYAAHWILRDTDGNAIDLTGATFVMKARYAAGAGGGEISSATLLVDDPTGGGLSITWLGSLFSSVPGSMDRVTLAYDLLMTLSGVPQILAFGPLYLFPGVS